MSIIYSKESVFDVGANAIVNTVNCRGIMGAGIALECSIRYPNMYIDYKKACSDNKISVGYTYLYTDNTQKILLFPTKDDPKADSKLEWIEEGLKYFIDNYRNYNIKSIAFPPLGCTNGHLNFERQVKPIMVKYLSQIDIDVYICYNCNFKNQHNQNMLHKLNSITYNELLKLDISEQTVANVILKRGSINYFEELASEYIATCKEDYVKLYNECNKNNNDIQLEENKNKKVTFVIGESPYPKQKERVMSNPQGLLSKYGFKEVAFISPNYKICQSLIFSILCGSLDKGTLFIKRYVDYGATHYLEKMLEENSIFFVNRVNNYNNLTNMINDYKDCCQCLIVGNKSTKRLKIKLEQMSIKYVYVPHPSPHNFVHEGSIIEKYFPICRKLYGFHVL